MEKRNCFLVFVLILIVAANLSSQSTQNDPRALKIVENYQQKLNLEDRDITTTFTMVQKKEGEADRVLKVTTYRRDREDTFTIIFEYPDSEKGKGYYRNGDNLYLYLPSTREFVYRNRRDDIGSTDVRTDIFGQQKTTELYYVSYAGREKVSKWECDVIRLDARSLDVSFPVQKWYVRKTDGLPVKVENYGVSETLLRTVYYVDYEEVGDGKYIFTKLLSVNNLEKGQKTFLSNDEVSTDSIPRYVFSKAYLEEQSR